MNTYQIDPAHSSAAFSIKHMMIAKVHGRFDKLSGQLSYGPATPSKASVVAKIDASSINTSEEKRDAHLRSASWRTCANRVPTRHRLAPREPQGAPRTAAVPGLPPPQPRP